MNFIREFWEFLKIRKKILAIADHNCASYFWRFNSVNSRISSRAVYLHHILEMKSILGISAFYHDSAACILIDGEIIAAAQEERFTRIKHDPSYPKHAIEFVLQYANLELSKVDQIIFFENLF